MRETGRMPHHSAQRILSFQNAPWKIGKFATHCGKIHIDKSYRNARVHPQMKHNPLISLLLTVLFVNAVFAALLTYDYMRSMRALQTLQLQRTVMTRELNIFNSLVNDTLEYSRRNPAVEPVLQTLGLKSGRTNTPAQPTGKR